MIVKRFGSSRKLLKRVLLKEDVDTFSFKEKEFHVNFNAYLFQDKNKFFFYFDADGGQISINEVETSGMDLKVLQKFVYNKTLKNMFEQENLKPNWFERILLLVAGFGIGALIFVFL